MRAERSAGPRITRFCYCCLTAIEMLIRRQILVKFSNIRFHENLSENLNYC
jgi:hypothetical protein